MRALIQRVTSASVTVEGRITGEIGAGLLILICAMEGDTAATATQMASKIAKLRIFKDDDDKMNRSILDTKGAALIVSQFTLAADLRGNRPGFSTAAKPDVGKALYEQFTQDVAALGVATANGIFGADMAVALVNDGPVTIWLDSTS